MDKFDCTLRCAIDSAIHFKFTVFCNCLDGQQSERRVLVAKETSSASVEKQGMKRCFWWGWSNYHRKKIPLLTFQTLDLRHISNLMVWPVQKAFLGSL